MMYFSGKASPILDNAKPYTWSTTTPWHHSRTFNTLWNGKYEKEDPELLWSLNPVSDKVRTTFLPQTFNSWSPLFPDVYRLL